MSNKLVQKMKTRKFKKQALNRKMRRLEARKRASRFQESIPENQVPLLAAMKLMAQKAESRKPVEE